MEKYVFNPNTQRLIKVGGDLYKDLLEKGEVSVDTQRYEMGASGDVKWRNVSPRKTSERLKIHGKCGDKCFLVPPKKEGDRPKYPICTGGDNCKLHCTGLLAAMNIGRLQKDQRIVNLATKIFKYNCKSQD